MCKTKGMASEVQRRRRRHGWAWALALSALLHLGLLLGLRHAALTSPPPEAASLAAADFTDFTIEETPPKAAVPTQSPAEGPPAKGPRLPRATRSAASSAAAPEAAGELAGEDVGSDGVPRRLDLTLRRPVDLGVSGGETVQNRPGLADLRPPLQTKQRIDGWFDAAEASERVERGLVDEWFSRLGRSLDRALARTPPPPPAAASAIAADLARGYLAAAEAFGHAGTPGPEGSAIPDPTAGMRSADLGPAAGLIAVSAPKLQWGAALEHQPSLFAVIEVQFDPVSQRARAKLLTSSGNLAFNDHVLHVVAGDLPELPDLPDGGLGIHVNGTRSVWQVEGRLTFERDVRTFKLKDDAWYLPVAALSALAGAAGSFDEVTGYVGAQDLRHPHLKCDVKLLQVY